jgi:hypothetical protein
VIRGIAALDLGSRVVTVIAAGGSYEGSWSGVNRALALAKLSEAGWLGAPGADWEPSVPENGFTLEVIRP